MRAPAGSRRSIRSLAAPTAMAALAVLLCAGAAPAPRRFLDLLDPGRISASLRTLSSVPRLAGTPADRKMADWVSARLADAGLKVEVAEYKVWLPYPVRISVEATGPEAYRCRLSESGNLVDPDTTMPGVVMPYNAYSPSGTAEGDLVYVNYGLRQDYEALEKLGVPVKGSIVIARYGKSFRGDKVSLAAEKGAIACLLYSDPEDDGYERGDVLPRGPWRDEWSVQRGNIMRSTGDPLTPGRPAIAATPRLDPADAPALPRIPTVPLSYGDARPLLAQLKGPLAPRESQGSGSWQGGLPFAYHVGPGPVRVKMAVQVEFASRPIWNVVGRLEGSVWPDEAVILGAHRDSWGPGASDNGSGSATLLEVARVFGEMAAAGSRPARTLMFGFWDAEEFGVIGSTEWAEEHAAWLSRSAVAYLNVDVAATGARFNPAASASLAKVLLEAAGGVADPITGKPILEIWSSSTPSPRVGDLGGGSDFVPFSDDFGIPSTSHGFSGAGSGAYHSGADTFWFVSTFMDPGFTYHAAAAGVWGLTALTLSESPLIPYDHEATGRMVLEAADEIEKNPPGRAEGARDAGGAAPPALEPVREAARRFMAVARRLESRRLRIGATPLAGAALALANAESMAAHRELVAIVTAADGSPSRRNLLLAPSPVDRYRPLRLPGLATAIAAGDAQAARREIALLCAALDRAASRLEGALRAARNL